jgi:hypothetical protein
VKRKLRVEINLNAFTVRMLGDRLLKGYLKMVAPEASNDSSGDLIYSPQPWMAEAVG